MGGWSRGRVETRDDRVATEEPLEIRVEHRGTERVLSVTMRTPGDDVALAAGFLLAEGIVENADDLLETKLCATLGPAGRPVENTVRALLSPARAVDTAAFSRNVYTNSACGVCGKTSLDALQVACAPLARGSPRLDPAVLLALPARLRARQAAFAETGGLHAAAFFSADGTLVDLAEDVGRHNALDKLVGRALLARRLPLSDTLVLVSGRASFELVQKAARAGVPALLAIGAPSSLAIDAARLVGMTLIGFLSADRFNIYCDAGRVAAPHVPSPPLPFSPPPDSAAR